MPVGKNRTCAGRFAEAPEFVETVRMPGPGRIHLRARKKSWFLAVLGSLALTTSCARKHHGALSSNQFVARLSSCGDAQTKKHSRIREEAHVRTTQRDAPSSLNAGSISIVNPRPASAHPVRFCAPWDRDAS